MPLDGNHLTYTPSPQPMVKDEDEIFSLRGLRDWLRTQEPTQSYCYVSNGHCLLAQYFGARGSEDVGMGSTFFYAGWPRLKRSLPAQMDAIAEAMPRTYADALSRCNTAIEKMEGVGHEP